MSIGVVIPTFGRADRLLAVARNAHAGTLSNHAIIFVVEADDRPSIEAAEEASRALFPYVQVLINGRARNYAGACNHAYLNTRHGYLFSGADDLNFCQGWDNWAVSEMRFGVVGHESIYVVGTQDLLNPYVQAGTHATHSLVDRRYLDQQGGVAGERGTWLFEGYDHQYTDAEFIDTARHRGVFAPCLNSVVEHVHFLTGKSAHDETYARAYAHLDEDAELYYSRLHLWGDVSNHIAERPAVGEAP